MKKLLTLGVLALGALVVVSGPADAQTTANGPYYAIPSWDQTLPAATRFIILSNFSSNAVLDRETGLVWEKSPLAPCLNFTCTVFGPGTLSWVDAQSHCNNLAVGVRKGWRLPTLQELASLIDPTVPPPGPTLPAGHPFSNVQSDAYWSATTSATFASAAWGVDLGGGGVFTGVKSNTLFAWCVRGGQGVDLQ